MAEAIPEFTEPLELPFSVAGVEWLARSGGTGSAGWGHSGPAAFEAVHFYRPGESRPRFEALTGLGRLPNLFAAELAELLRTATPVPPAP